MIKLVVFDWDDTFTLHSLAGYMACYQAALKDVGQERDYETTYTSARRFWGQPHEATLADLLQGHEDLVQQACDAYETHLFGGTYVEKLDIVQGSAEFIEHLKTKYTLAICTGAHPKILKDAMNRFGIPDVFTAIVSSYELHDPRLAKPHSHMLEEVMKRCDALPAHTIMVGDGDNDVEMAKNAGVEPVVVLTGHLSEAEAHNMGVRYVVSDITKLESVLSKHG